MEVETPLRDVFLDWLVAMDPRTRRDYGPGAGTFHYHEVEEKAYGEHMYDRRGSRRRSAEKNKKFLSLRIHFYQVMSKRTY